MCITCWKDYGSPDVHDHKVMEAIELIAAVENACNSSGLHAILDDWNLDDTYFDPEDITLTDEEQKCYQFMAGLTLDERASALAHYEGWI